MPGVVAEARLAETREAARAIAQVAHVHEDVLLGVGHGVAGEAQPVVVGPGLDAAALPDQGSGLAALAVANLAEHAVDADRTRGPVEATLQPPAVGMDRSHQP